MTDEKMTDEELAQEAAKWVGNGGELTGWVDSPTSVPRNKKSVSISLRIPRVMLGLLREFAKREGIGYQVLMKKWIDERIRREAIILRRSAAKGQILPVKQDRQHLEGLKMTDISKKLSEPTNEKEPVAFPIDIAGIDKDWDEYFILSLLAKHSLTRAQILQYNDDELDDPWEDDLLIESIDQLICHTWIVEKDEILILNKDHPAYLSSFKEKYGSE